MISQSPQYGQGDREGVHPDPAVRVPKSTNEAQRSGGVHVLKTWPQPFRAVRAKLKPWEFRRNDRDFRVGDTLWLEEWDPNSAAATGEVEVRLVTFMLEGPSFGIPDGYCIMTMTDCPAELDRALSSHPSDEVGAIASASALSNGRAND